MSGRPTRTPGSRSRTCLPDWVSDALRDGKAVYDVDTKAWTPARPSEQAVSDAHGRDVASRAARYGGGAKMGPERSTRRKSRPAAWGIHTPDDDEEFNQLDGQPPIAQPTRQWWPPMPGA
jgi:hypothetical protein